MKRPSSPGRSGRLRRHLRRNPRSLFRRHGRHRAFVDAGSSGNLRQLTNSGMAGSRPGLRDRRPRRQPGNANFWLEAGISNDNGTGVANNLNNAPGGVSPTGARA